MIYIYNVPGLQRTQGRIPILHGRRSRTRKTRKTRVTMIFFEFRYGVELDWVGGGFEWDAEKLSDES
jgi:hypothetical protein